MGRQHAHCNAAMPHVKPSVRGLSDRSLYPSPPPPTAAEQTTGESRTPALRADGLIDILAKALHAVSGEPQAAWKGRQDKCYDIQFRGE